MQRFIFLHPAHDRSREIESPGSIETGHLSGFTAGERHPVALTSAGDSLDNTGGLLYSQRRAGHVIHEPDGPGCVDQNVIYAVIDKILAHRIEAPRLERHQDLGPDSVRAEHQHRLPKVGGHSDHSAEGADASKGERRSGGPDQSTNALFRGLRRDQIDAGREILSARPVARVTAHFTSSARATWVRSRKVRTLRCTSINVTPSNPRIPKCDTAYEPMAAPYTIAEGMLPSVTDSGRAR